MKPSLLFLVHRIPFPPNKGDKIRSYNMLKHLSQKFDIHLGCFIDDKEDLGYDNDLLSFCKRIKLIEQNPFLCKVKGLTGFITNKPITLPYYKSQEMQEWVDATIADHHIERVLVFSAAMAQFVEVHLNKLSYSVLDFIDVDSDKWRQYAAEKSGIKAWFYAREARLLQQYEIEMANVFDASTFVSDEEASMFKSLLPQKSKNKVQGIRNGVDTVYFDPKSNFSSVTDISEKSIAFTGAMDYWANVNAVLWFVENVWALVLNNHKNAIFYIVGSKPSAEILALNGKFNIVVTGRVEDVRPFIAETRATIAPLQIARGIQNKVLEALAMGKIIVLSSKAAEGIGKSTGTEYLVEDEPASMARLICEVLENKMVESQQNRDFVYLHFSWESEMQKFSDLLKGVTNS